MSKHYLLLLWLVSGAVLGQSIPQYYNNVDFTMSKDIVKQQITYLITNTHHEIGYREVWEVLDRADEDPDNPQNVLLIYGYENGDENSKYARSRKKNAKHRGGSTKGKWNREHVFAKSLGSPKLIGEGNKIDAGSDAHNLRASDGSFNSTRGNKIFADAKGIARAVSKNAWYPGDEWKGDVARIIMYMYVRYGTRTIPNAIGDGGNTIYQVPDMPDIFLKWNVEDPVSDFERKRNQEIYYTQTNRNPFIDNPYLATLIWGGDKAEDTWNLENTLSTNENPFAKKEDISLYPSISNRGESINISEQVNSLEVYNTTGQLVSIKKNIKSFIAPTQTGIYLVRMLSKENNKLVTKKIIVK